jgi:hypothetical protein
VSDAPVGQALSGRGVGGWFCITQRTHCSPSDLCLQHSAPHSRSAHPPAHLHALATSAVSMSTPIMERGWYF